MHWVRMCASRCLDSGPDSTSAFCGKGKKVALDLLEVDQVAVKTGHALGDSFHISNELFDLCEKFTVRLYGCKHLDKVNDARFYLFCTKNHHSQRLPPTQDALKKHTARANYQAAVWKRALDPQPDVPSPDGHGWTLDNGILNILWTHQEPAPKVLMQFISCGCKTTCGTRRCSCKAVDLPCTDACRCSRDCLNRVMDPCVAHITDDQSDSEA